jgi:hypothetical protein
MKKLLVGGDWNIEHSFRAAALEAQQLVLAARAIESRVSALSPDTPDAVVLETALLIKAAALQIAGIVHALVAHSERMAMGLCQPNSDPE